MVLGTSVIWLAPRFCGLPHQFDFEDGKPRRNANHGSAIDLQHGVGSKDNIRPDPIRRTAQTRVETPVSLRGSVQSRSSPILSEARKADKSAEALSAKTQAAAPSRLHTYSEKMAAKTSKAIQRISESIRLGELKRTEIETWRSSLSVRLKAVIAPPTPDDIRSIVRLIEIEANELLADERRFFVVDALRMLNEFSSFSKKYKIAFFGSGRELDGTPNPRLIVFEADDLSGFSIGDNGREIYPSGTASEISRLWFDQDGQPVSRYMHLFSGE